MRLGRRRRGDGASGPQGGRGRSSTSGGSRRRIHRWLCWEGAGAGTGGGIAMASQQRRRPRVATCRRCVLCIASVVCVSAVVINSWTSGYFGGGGGRWTEISSWRILDMFQSDEQWRSRQRESIMNMLSLIEESSEKPPVETMRKYLNDLVKDSVSRKSKQLSNIAFIKTHKTASTTFASILYRYGMRHRSEIAKFDQGSTFIDLDKATKQVSKRGKRVEIMHYHHAWDGFYSGSWGQAKKKYSRIMSEKEPVNYVTVLREPVAHYLSYYYYFLNPVNKLPIGEYLKKKPNKDLLFNPLAAEFGIRNANQLNDFINNQMPNFRMVLLTERFDEGLALLQRMLQWDPIDMTYCRMLQTKKGEKRWDGKPLQNVPKIKNLRPEVLKRIKARTQLDTRLYRAAEQLYRKYKLEFEPDVDENFETFQGLQKIMHTYLSENASSEALNWYVGSVDIYDHGPPVLEF